MKTNNANVPLLQKQISDSKKAMSRFAMASDVIIEMLKDIKSTQNKEEAIKAILTVGKQSNLEKMAGDMKDLGMQLKELIHEAKKMEAEKERNFPKNVIKIRRTEEAESIYEPHSPYETSRIDKKEILSKTNAKLKAQELQTQKKNTLERVNKNFVTQNPLSEENPKTKNIIEKQKQPNAAGRMAERNTKSIQTTRQSGAEQTFFSRQMKRRSESTKTKKEVPSFSRNI